MQLFQYENHVQIIRFQMLMKNLIGRSFRAWFTYSRIRERTTHLGWIEERKRERERDKCIQFDCCIYLSYLIRS